MNDKTVKALEILAVTEAGREHTERLHTRSKELYLKGQLTNDPVERVKIAAEMIVIKRLMNECLEISKECNEAANQLAEES